MLEVRPEIAYGVGDESGIPACLDARIGRLKKAATVCRRERENFLTEKTGGERRGKGKARNGLTGRADGRK